MFAVALAACGTAHGPPLPLNPLVAVRKKPEVWIPGRSFDRVATRLRESYYNKVFRDSELPTLIAQLQDSARASTSPAGEREVIWRLLARIPATHSTLLSRPGYAALMQEIDGTPHPTLGLQVVRVEGRYFATMVLAGGPADAAGIHPWDEIVAVDGRTPGASRRLDWRSDDAYLMDERDPPTYGILVVLGDTVTLTVADEPGRTRDVAVAAKLYSAMQASRKSVRVFERDGVQIGYIHWWYMHSRVPEMFVQELKAPFGNSDALVLDLRGRGGSGRAVERLLDLLGPGRSGRYQGPVVALIDRQTRSAKEILAAELRSQGLGRLVGETTAGAVVGALFVEVGDSAILMYPGEAVKLYTDQFELRPIDPDVRVTWGGPYSGARDVILEAGIDEAVRLVRVHAK